MLLLIPILQKKDEEIRSVWVPFKGSITVELRDFV
jgi:hypothetical protein